MNQVLKRLSVVAVLICCAQANEPEGERIECHYPGDCMRAHFGAHAGKCESRSAWRQQFLSATPEERKKLRAQRSIGMQQRMLVAYEANDSQRQVIEKILSEEYAAHHAAMGKFALEVDELRKLKLNRKREIWTQAKEQHNGGDSAISIPDPESDPVLVDLHKRVSEIERQYPINWEKIADRIEMNLSAEQAARGRLRLSDDMPHRFSARKREDNSGASGKAGNYEHPWDRYLIAFAEKYSLDAGQYNSAISILRELKAKDAIILDTLSTELNAARGEAERAAAEVRLGDIDDVRDLLFQELKNRLKGLLTQSQLSLEAAGEGR